MFWLNCFRFNSAHFSGVTILGKCNFRLPTRSRWELRSSGYNAESSGNFLPTFRGKLSVSSSRMNFSSLLKMRPIGCPETSVRNYHYSRRVISEKSAVLTLGQVPPLSIFLTGDFAKTFGTSKLHLFHHLFYKIPNLKDCVGGGNRTFVRKLWISCSLQ